MALQKRQRSLTPDTPAGETRAVDVEQHRSSKRPKPAEIVEPLIEVKLRSNSKAVKNDPKSKEDLAAIYERLGLSTAPDSKTTSGPSPSPVETVGTIPNASISRAETRIDNDLPSTTPSLGDQDGHSESETDSEDNEDGEFACESDGSEDFACDSENDEFAEFEWLEQMDSTATCGESTVAYCNAKLIRRARIASMFYDEVEQPSQETSKLAFDLFDRYGRLKQDYKTHTIKKGSGIWQDEFDTGDLLLFEYIDVDLDHRRKGLATKLIEAVLEKVRSKSRLFYAVALPEPLTREVDSQVTSPGRYELLDMSEEDKAPYYEAVRVVELREIERAMALFRKIGFRRVGASNWLALSSDSSHVSHTLSVADDFDLDIDLDSERPMKLSSPFNKQDPASMTDESLLHLMKQSLSGVPMDDPRWYAVDQHRNNILHLAARGLKPMSVEWLLKQCESLRSPRNDKGETALDVLYCRLEEVRTRLQHGLMIVHVSDRFQGYEDEAVQCVALLKGITPAWIVKLRIKFGCSCDQCIAGFLSPRMLFCLKNEADSRHDLLDFAVESDTGPDFVEFHDNDLQFVSPSVRQNMETNKSMRQGFANLFEHFSTCIQHLDASPQSLVQFLPIPANVAEVARNASEWPPSCRNYLQRGGNVEAVGSSIFWVTMQQDHFTGDGMLPNAYDNDSIEDFGGLRAQWKGLPSCRNDLEYGFVSSMLGYGGINNT